MIYRDFISDLLFIVVLYRKKISECASIQSIKTVYDGIITSVFVYDNSPEYNSDSPEQIKNCKVYYKSDFENSGVSKGYNEGARLAKKLGKNWLLLLDQDTAFDSKAMEMYFQSIIKYPENELFVPVLKSKDQIISPCKYFLKSGFLFKKEFFGLAHIRHKSVLNSGICISLNSYENIGGYDERVKLYFSDFNFIDRYRKKYSTFVVVETIFQHDFALLELDTEKSIPYFINYCIGARSLVNNLLDYLILLVVVFYWLILLSYRFRRWVYINIFIKYYVLRRGSCNV